MLLLLRSDEEENRSRTTRFRKEILRILNGFCKISHTGANQSQFVKLASSAAIIIKKDIISKSLEAELSKFSFPTHLAQSGEGRKIRWF